jgi:hypothetical protein
MESQRLVTLDCDNLLDWPSFRYFVLFIFPLSFSPFYRLRLITFDVPNYTAVETPFEDRFAYLHALVERDHPFLISINLKQKNNYL